MSQHATLPLNCPVCGGPITLGFSGWPPAEPRHSQTWKCPHCHTENHAQFAGKVEWVLARQSDDPQRTTGHSKTKH